jgi:hypothetical protein
MPSAESIFSALVQWWNTPLQDIYSHDGQHLLHVFMQIKKVTGSAERHSFERLPLDVSGVRTL